MRSRSAGASAPALTLAVLATLLATPALAQTPLTPGAPSRTAPSSQAPSSAAPSRTTEGPRLQAQPGGQLSAGGSQGDTQPAQPRMASRMDSQVETRIRELHQKLRITQAQESAWRSFADAMRQGAQHIDSLFAQRRADARATAVDEMNFYADLTAAHAEDTASLASAFSGLYAQLSDTQKRAADQNFRTPRNLARGGRPAGPAANPAPGGGPAANAPSSPGPAGGGQIR